MQSTRMSSSHSAAQVLAGYLWQIHRTFLALLRGDFGESIQIETLDDIVVLRDGKLIVAAEQTKHSFGDSDLGIASSEWWRTLRVWLDLLSDGHLREDTELVLCTTGGVSSELAAMTTSRTDADIAHLLVAHNTIAARRPNENLAKAYAKWEAASEPDRRAILSRAVVEPGHPKLSAAKDEVDKDLRRFGIPPGKTLAVIRDRLLGWFQTEVESRLQSKGCEIRYEELNAQLTELWQELSPRALPCLHADASPPKLGTDRKDDPNYLRQLTLLNANDEDLTLAVTMYHRATAERDYWMNDQIAGIGTLRSYDADLVNAWLQERSHVNRAIGKSAEDDRGWRLFESCMRYRGSINGVPAPTHVANGTFHRLADQPEDPPEIGWHPRYPELLRKSKE